MSASADKERFLQAVDKPVRDVKLPEASAWEDSRVYAGCRAGLMRLFFDRGTHTDGHALELEHFDPDFVHYEPSGWLCLRWALRQLRPGPTDTFVDFGCGKGRVICEAARLPFFTVIGVEVSQPLVSSARANVERDRANFKCQQVEVVNADAAEWPVPDDMTVAYLYHPFAGDTFRRVINNVIRSIERNPRRVQLVYACPVLEDRVADTGYFRLVKRRRGHGRRGRVTNGVVIFEHDPADARLAHPS